MTFPRRNAGGQTPTLPALLLRTFTLLALTWQFALAGCRAQPRPWPLWEAYTKRFLDEQGRVIDRSTGDRTTSEGQAYAMFFALVTNDRAHFDKLLNWTELNLAEGDLTLRLPAWSWGKSPTGEWRILDANSAADADLWLAYTLIEAGSLWHEPRYDKLGRVLAARIAHEEVVLIPGIGTTLAPGPSGFHPDPDAWYVNPSYLPLPVLIGLAREMPEGPWSAILRSLPAIIGGQPSNGFAMDWVLAGPVGVRPSAPPTEPSAGAREAQAAGSYDAIRVYLWLGLADPATPGLHELLGQVSAMATYLRDAATPPLEVDPQGHVLRADAPPGFSAAVVPYLAAAGMKLQTRGQRDRLAATQDPPSGLYGRSGEYYDQNLALFSTGWSEERFRFSRDGKLSSAVEITA